MKAPHAIRAAVVVAFVWAGHSACDWEELDAIASLQGAGDVQVSDAEVVADGSEAADVSDGETEDGRLFSDSSSRAQDATSAGDGANTADAFDALAADASETSVACATAGASAVKQWTFDATTEGWAVLDGTGTTVTWVNAGPTPGALEVDGLPVIGDAASSQSHIGVDELPGVDLSGRTLSALLWLDSGTSPTIKLFVQTGPLYTWADGGSIVLPLRTWTCASLNVSAPSYTSQNGVYDPTDVVRIGFELDETAPYRLYIDSVSY
jgi:hypothetical protein